MCIWRGDRGREKKKSIKISEHLRDRNRNSKIFPNERCTENSYDYRM